MNNNLVGLVLIFLISVYSSSCRCTTDNSSTGSSSCSCECSKKADSRIDAFNGTYSMECAPASDHISMSMYMDIEGSKMTRRTDKYYHTSITPDCSAANLIDSFSEEFDLSYQYMHKGATVLYASTISFTIKPQSKIEIETLKKTFGLKEEQMKLGAESEVLKYIPAKHRVALFQLKMKGNQLYFRGDYDPSLGDKNIDVTNGLLFNRVQ